MLRNGPGALPQAGMRRAVGAGADGGSGCGWAAERSGSSSLPRGRRAFVESPWRWQRRPGVVFGRVPLMRPELRPRLPPAARTHRARTFSLEMIGFCDSGELVLCGPPPHREPRPAPRPIASHSPSRASVQRTGSTRTGAGDGSDGICRVIDGCQRQAALPFGLPAASHFTPFPSRPPSPDPKRFRPKMKRHLRSTFTALVLASVASGADRRDEVAVVGNPADDYLSICGWEFDVDGGGYSTCAIDLDGDGLLDQLFTNAATSGTGGQTATVYLARKDGKFTRIGTLGHGAMATETIKTGGRLLHCSWSPGGGSTSITTYLVSHEGLKEVMVSGGRSDDEEYQKRFRAVFAETLSIDYKFVAARPGPKAEPNRVGQPATRSASK